MTRDNKDLTKIVAACLLGDASIEKDNREKGAAKHCQFSMSLIVDHKQYLEELKERLSPITTFSLLRSKEERDAVICGMNTHCKEQWRLRSHTHPFFDKFRERMYGTGRKSVDPHYLTLIDWEFLYHWYVQDGCLSCYIAKGIYPQYRIVLNSQGFSYGENHNLRSALKENLDLDFRVTKQKSVMGNIGYYLMLAPRQIDMFIENTGMFLTVSSFAYKFDKKSLLCRTEESKQKRLEHDIVCTS